MSDIRAPLVLARFSAERHARAGWLARAYDGRPPRRDRQPGEVGHQEALV